MPPSGLLSDPFLRETLAPVASLSGGGRSGGASAPPPLQRRNSLLLGRSESITRERPQPPPEARQEAPLPPQPFQARGAARCHAPGILH